MSNADWSFETRQIHAGQFPDSATGARALPIYQTTSYVFDSTEHAANLFALKEFGNIYTRIMNPTQDVIEQRVASLEGGVGALLVSSGQAAETLTILNLAEAGDHVVASPSLYGGTYNLLKYTLPKFGIEVSFIEDPTDLGSWQAAIQPNTKLLFGETIANPKVEILDIEALADLAHSVGVPLVVDNTVATPFVTRPIEWGADIVLHSATKYLGGHGTSIGGVIVDAGRFDFGADPEKYPAYNTPEESYHGLVFARDLGVGSPLGANLAFILKARVQLLRDLGPAISPFNAFLIGQGIETLSLRIERHLANTHRVARLPARTRAGRVGPVGVAAGQPRVQARPEVLPAGLGRRARLRDRRWSGGRQAVRRGAHTAQPCRQHRRRALLGHPPRLHDPLARSGGGPAGRRGHPGAGAPGRGHRAHRRHPRRPRAGLRRGTIGACPWVSGAEGLLQRPGSNR